MSLLEKFIVLIILLFLSDQARAHYTFQLALNSWTNTMRWWAGRTCCDGNAPPLNCTNICDTRFEICIQPFSYSASEINCPYGRYDTQNDETLPDTDDIMFPSGVNIAGNVPNPMTFTIPSSISEGLRVRITAFDFDDHNEDDLIDIMRVGMQPINTSNDFVTLPKVTGQYDVGTLVISYRVQCSEGYCGPDCTQRNCNEATCSTGTVKGVGPTSQVDTTYGPLSQVQFYSILAALGLLLIFIGTLILCIFVAILVVCKRNKKRNNNTVIQGEVQVISSNRSDTELSSVVGGHTEPRSFFNSYNINTSTSPYPLIPRFSPQQQHNSNTTHSTTPSFGSLNNDGEEEGEYDYMNSNALTQMKTHNSSNKLHSSDDESVIYTKPFGTPVDPVYTKPHTKSGIHSGSMKFPTSENPAYGTN